MGAVHGIEGNDLTLYVQCVGLGVHGSENVIPSAEPNALPLSIAITPLERHVESREVDPLPVSASRMPPNDSSPSTGARIGVLTI